MTRIPSFSTVLHSFACVLLASASLTGCAADVTGDSSGGGGGGGGGEPSTPEDPRREPPNGDQAIFAHTHNELFQISPDTFELSSIGVIGWPDSDIPTFDNIGDIAIDRQGYMYGISIRQDRLYSINAETAEAVVLAELGENVVYNALSMVPDGSGGEMLVGVQRNGTVSRIDTVSGEISELGHYGEGLLSSGDLVHVDGLGTVATVRLEADGTDATDQLALVDMDTFEATLIGDLGYKNVWGLGFWGENLFGFTSNGPTIDAGGTMIVIDYLTGQTMVAGDAPGPFWGAAVTTSAPVEIE